MTSKRIADDVALDRDAAVPMSDGVRLMANVFQPYPPRALHLLLALLIALLALATVILMANGLSHF